LGRRIYAVGGNPDAAELSGISVEKTLIIVFISMGILALISGVMYASRLQNTSPNHGPFWELYAIAAAFIGGTSASGGVGKVVNAVIGSIVIMSLKNGMALAGIDANIEPIILGSVLLLAVVFDIYTRNVRPVDLVGIHYAKKEYKEEFKLAKIEYDKAKLELKNAKKANVDNIIEFEYKFTNTQGTFNKIKDKIRVAQEEDFIKS
jgi:putative multiple sugar transport system permease protein